MKYTDKEIELIKMAAYYEGYAAGVKDSLLKKAEPITPIPPYIPPRDPTWTPPYGDPTWTPYGDPVVTMYGVRPNDFRVEQSTEAFSKKMDDLFFQSDLMVRSDRPQDLH